MAKWLDFKDLRQRLSFEAVLRHYGVELKLKANGKQHQGFCPLPTHNGQKRSPSFSANLEKGIFNCFGCQAQGNVLDFACRMEGIDPGNGNDFRKVALKLQEKFLPETLNAPPKGGAKNEDKSQNGANAAPVPTTTPATTSAPTKAESNGTVVVNAPLDFELKDLDATHPYLAGRGFSAETNNYFGLGFCARGLMKGRLAVPLHNSEGKLIGYCGRLIDDSAISEAEPKYKFPGKRQRRDGTIFEFHKSTFLYNAHRIPKPTEELVIVEGFPAVWWLFQNGYKNVVALMGSACSDEQARLILHATTQHAGVLFFPDGDEAGSRCAESLFIRVAPHRFIRWLRLENAKQPTDCSPEQLTAFLGSPAKGGTA